MPPKRIGRDRSSSRSRRQSAEEVQIDQEENKDPPPQDEDHGEEKDRLHDDSPHIDNAGAPPQHAVNFALPQAAVPQGQQQAYGALPAFQGMAAQQRAPYLLQAPTEKISTLTKNIVKLAHGNFAAWHKAIDEIAYYRKWDKTRLLNENFTWDQVEEQDQIANQQRRDAYWVLTCSMPVGSDFYHLRTGIVQGDANALYKKVIKLFLAKNPQNRGALRKQFNSITMASTRLDVSRFAAKVVEVATELRKIGAKVDDDEINTVFLDGLSRKFSDIVTVETVAENDFDTMLSNVLLYANKHKLMSYRETNSHAFHHLAQEDVKRQQHHALKSFDSRSHKQQTNRPQKKKFFKKKERPRGQFKRWSAGGYDFKHGDDKSRDTRPPRHQPHRNGVRQANNREQKQPFMCMQQAVTTLVSEATETQPASEGDHDQYVKGLLLQELSPMRGRHIELQKLVNSQTTCSRTEW